MLTCPQSLSKNSVANLSSEWDLAILPTTTAPLLLDRNSPNVHALSSKLSKEDIEAWDDDQDFVSFDPIFEQLQFQQSGRLPRSPMSDASGSSGADYFQHSVALSIPASTPTPTSTLTPTSFAIAAATRTSLSTLMNTPSLTPCTLTIPAVCSVHKKSHAVSHSDTESSHAPEKKAHAISCTAIDTSMPLSPTLFPHSTSPTSTTTATSATTATAATTTTTTTTTTTATTTATIELPSSTATKSTTIPTPLSKAPLSVSASAIASSAISTATATATATAAPATTSTLPSLRTHRQNTLTTSTSNGALFATNYSPQPINESLPPLAPPPVSSCAYKGKQSQHGAHLHSKGLGTVTAATPVLTSSSSSPTTTRPSKQTSTAVPPVHPTSLPSPSPSCNDDDSPTPSSKSMTTITQEMMLSAMATYSGVITRINPIRRVAAWVDDLDGLEVPEQQDLDFNQVRTTLAKSLSIPETLEATEGWETESESGFSMTNSEDHFSSDLQRQQPLTPLTPVTLTTAQYRTSLQSNSSGPGNSLSTSLQTNAVENHPTTDEANGGPEPDIMETLGDDLDLLRKVGSFQLNLDARWRQNQFDATALSSQPSASPLQPLQSPSSHANSSSLLRWQDTNVIPISSRPVRQIATVQNEPEDFWEGIDIDDDQAFQHKGRNKNLILRPNIQGRARSGSRVQRQVVPLKDFVALPSRIPRLCRAPGDTSRAVTPAPALSRTHSTHFDLPLRNLKTKSSLPRLKKQPSITRRDGGKMPGALPLPSSDGTLVPVEGTGSSSPSSPFVSRATTPISIQLNTGHRSSWHLGKDDLPSFKSSSLALRSVSFVEERDGQAATSSSQSSLSKATGTIPKPEHLFPEETTSDLPPAGKAFASLRTMVKKWDWGRHKAAPRGHIPSFLSTSTTPCADTEDSQHPAVAIAAQEFSASSEEAKALNIHEKKAADRPRPVSRSSSYSDWGHPFVQGPRDSGPPSRSATNTALDAQLSGLDVLDGVSSTGSVAEKFPKRFFLKRSLKHNNFGDGFELEQFDNLPTFQAHEEAYQVQMHEIAQGRRQSMDRVAAWLWKPQSNANLKEMPKIEEIATELDVPEPQKLRKSKSIRRSLFDIFGPNSSETTKSKKKRKKALAGPTLTPIHSQASVHKFSDSTLPYVPWNENNDSEKFDADDDNLEERTEYSEDSVAFVQQQKKQQQPQFEFPEPPPPHKFFPTSPLLNATMAAVNRPALISNLSQYSKQRTQVSGKMMFDPVRMCWIFNPEYLARRRRRSGQQVAPEPEDDIWGDEPDIFAGLSDGESNKSQEDFDEDDDTWDRPSLSRNSSVRLSGPNGWTARRRLLARPWLPRYPSQEFLKEDDGCKMWDGMMKVPPTTPNSVDGRGDSRPSSMGVHSVVSKSSRRSLNGHHGTGTGFVSNGISSCGEFEVGVEFDITEDFLEQCIAAEAQHRKDAGRFFALPCSPPDEKVPVAQATMSKIRTLGKKSNKKKSAAEKIERVEVLEIAEKSENKPPFKAWTGTLKSRLESSAKAKSSSKATTRAKEFVIESSSSQPPACSKSRRSSTTLGSLGSGWEAISKQDKDGGKREKGSTRAKEPPLLSPATGSTGDTMSKTQGLPFTSFSSWQSSSTGTATAGSVISPTTATLAVSGRSGSRRKVNTLQFDERQLYSCSQSPLSFSATLAVARKGKYNSYGKRRIDVHTFRPPVLTANLALIDVEDSSPIRGGIFRLKRMNSRKQMALPDDSDESEVDEDDFIDRGYRSMSNSRGRPPHRPRADLLFELEKYAPSRFHT
ncbi:hypothetical protein BG004_002827 [Podila humilis]|nr:hypothetical protein BG004_002827 [Podila humilis]